MARKRKTTTENTTKTPADKAVKKAPAKEKPR